MDRERATLSIACKYRVLHLLMWMLDGRGGYKDCVQRPSGKNFSSDFRVVQKGAHYRKVSVFSTNFNCLRSLDADLLCPRRRRIENRLLLIVLLQGVRPGKVVTDCEAKKERGGSIALWKLASNVCCGNLLKSILHTCARMTLRSRRLLLLR